MSARGSALIEAATAAATLCLLVSGGLSISYMAFARVWLERSVYEGVVCLATSSSIDDCRKNLVTAASSALPMGRVSELRLERNTKSAEIALRFRLLGREVIRVRDRRALPLGGRG